mmetsp:Transcript_25235/g.49314  ORF Transcript_25235/g.49314 Transcript_25235/m.49314 type:complete len:131 (-) Transcript_25235:50-442(-)
MDVPLVVRLTGWLAGGFIRKSLFHDSVLVPCFYISLLALSFVLSFLLSFFGIRSVCMSFSSAFSGQFFEIGLFQSVRFLLLLSLTAVSNPLTTERQSLQLQAQAAKASKKACTCFNQITLPADESTATFV